MCNLFKRGLTPLTCFISVMLLMFALASGSSANASPSSQSISAVAKSASLGLKTALQSTATCSGYAKPDVGMWLPGTKHHPEKIWAGTWSHCGHSGLVCSAFALHASDGTRLEIIDGRIPGFSRSNSKSTIKAVNQWHGTSSNRKAAQLASLVWDYSNSKAWHADESAHRHALAVRGLLKGFNAMKLAA